MKKSLITISLMLILSACQSSQPAINLSEKAEFDKAVSLYQAQDYQNAKRLFEQSTHMKAKRYLGLMYLNGQGVAKDETLAFRQFKISAEQGDITSQYWLGFCYENGIGTSKDINQAISWYQKSAQRGDHVSQPAIDALKRLNVQL